MEGRRCKVNIITCKELPLVKRKIVIEKEYSVKGPIFGVVNGVGIRYCI